MPRLVNQLPTYRLHKQSGQAIVTLSGRDYLLGKYGSAASRKAYEQITGEWLLGGRHLPQESSDLTVTELIALYRPFVQSYYRRPDGSETTEVRNIASAMRLLREMYGTLSVNSFGPLRLEAVRNAMIEKRWCRVQINKQIGRIKRFFAWGVSREMIHVSVHTALQTVRGLSVGRSGRR